MVKKATKIAIKNRNKVKKKADKMIKKHGYALPSEVAEALGMRPRSVSQILAHYQGEMGFDVSPVSAYYNGVCDGQRRVYHESGRKPPERIDVKD